MNGSTIPDVTIITVCYNAYSYLPACIDSVFKQRSANISIEHLIIDGNSTDGTVEFLHQMHQQGYISNFISEPDDGIYDAMNKGISLAKGKIIAFLNADDVFLDGSIPALSNPILHGKSDYTIGTARVRKASQLSHYLWPDLGNAYMGATCCHQTLFCKTKIIRNLGGFDGTNFPTIADGDLMAKLAAHKYKPYCVSGVHVIFREGGASDGCITTAADQYACLLKKYWIPLVNAIQANPEHLYRVRWDINNKLKCLHYQSNTLNDYHTLSESLIKLQKELQKFETNRSHITIGKQLKWHGIYYLHRILSKICYGKIKRYFQQKKYFSKQQIKWHAFK